MHKWATNNDELAKLVKLNESYITEMHKADDETYVKDSLGNSYISIEKFWVLIGAQVPINLYLNLAILLALPQN